MHNTIIPFNNPDFQRILKFYLFECPARSYDRIGKEKDTLKTVESQIDPKYNYHFHRVSKRGVSFYDKGIYAGRLNSFRAAMKRVAATNIVLDSVDSLDDYDELDKNEYLIIKRNYQNISDTEGYFYCIRNAFAHGNFDVSKQGYYIFENSNRGKLKGIGRLSKRTLLAWIDLFNMDIDDIKNAGK